MITCAINGCPSTQYMRINGEQISFFAFPEDDAIKSQWLENCNLASGIVNNIKTPYLCELHFEKIDFTPSKDLKAEAVPTLFGHVEEPPKKYPAEDIQETIPKKMPLKDQSLHDQILTPSESSSLQDDITEQNDKSKMDVSIDSERSTNGCDTSLEHEKSKTKTKIYRLTIRIDKIRNQSVLKKKPVSFTEAKTTKFQEPMQKKRKGMCMYKSCKLRECLFYTKPALQCEVCEQYYFQKEEDTYSCSVCSDSFPDPQKLCIHIRKHYECEICHLENDSEKAYEKHIRLHTSTDLLNPFKCHQCYKTFAYKDTIKQHYLREHSKMKLQTGAIQIKSPSVATIFSDHLKSHRTEEGVKFNISEGNNIIPVPSPLTGNQIGFLQPVKFSCCVCQQQFDSVCEVDAHTKTHLKERKSSQDGLKCNICKKVFTDNTVFGEHLKQHLSRAYPCPVCSKAFINKTTLRAHLVTHSKSISSK